MISELGVAETTNGKKRATRIETPRYRERVIFSETTNIFQRAITMMKTTKYERAA